MPLAPVISNPAGRMELVLARDIATAERVAERRGAKWAAAADAAMVNRTPAPFGRATPCVVVGDVTDMATANAVAARWRCPVLLHRTDQPGSLA